MVGVDTGGTFTDLIAVDPATGEFRLGKVPSVPDDPSAAVQNALEELFAKGVAPGDVSLFVHGTTVATNALLEAKGVRAGLLITRGFRAVYEARGWSQPSGSDVIDPHYRKPPLLASQWLTEEVSERVDYRGDVIAPIDDDDLRRAVRSLKAKGIEAVAVCFLFSFLNPDHERRAAAVIAEEAPEWRVSLSSVVLPVIREYPRLSTTVIDAYVGPTVARYLLRLADRLHDGGVVTPQRFLMQSNGGLMRLSIGARFPNQTLLSGPAAGVVAATELGRITDRSHLITFDMGGTSTDISVIVDGRVLETSEGRIAGQDIGSPMLKVRTLGAGGGTLAWIGKDGLLKVGPHSAGAAPGPACYGRGGEQPTVTDANLVLGALSGATPLAGKFRLDEALARRAIATHVGAPMGLDAVEAAAIVRIVNTNMAVDLRLALQEEGQDPRRFALVAFGGAGPIHAAQLARDLGIPRVLVPPYPGINCATGLLQTEVKHSYLRSSVGILGTFPAERMNALFAELEAQALADVAEEGFTREATVLRRRLDLRYLHQGYQLTVDVPARALADTDKPELKAAFDALHRQIYGQSAEAEDAEIVTFRVQAEIAIDRFAFPKLAAGAGPVERARTGERPLYDFGRRTFVTAQVYDRAKLAPGDRIAGPAVVNQFDATTVVLAGQSLIVDSYGILAIDVGTASA
jgi:N-methylhydantoinase A